MCDVLRKFVSLVFVRFVRMLAFYFFREDWRLRILKVLRCRGLEGIMSFKTNYEATKHFKVIYEATKHFKVSNLTFSSVKIC